MRGTGNWLPVAFNLVDLDELVAELVRHSRLLPLIKAHAAVEVPPGLEHGATLVLAHLVTDGPLRQGELSEVALLDPSTVSRRVGQLVAHGLVERQSDPDDGRAVRLAATDAGRALFERVRARRRELMDLALAGWSDADLEELVRLLRRLNDGIAAVARPTATRPADERPGAPGVQAGDAPADALHTPSPN